MQDTTVDSSQARSNSTSDRLRILRGRARLWGGRSSRQSILLEVSDT